MKKTYETHLNLAHVDWGLLIFRIGIAGLMLTHGFPKLLRFFGNDPITFGDPLGIGEVASLGLVVFAEFVCAILVLIGLGTRLAVIPIIITMAVAAFIVHATDGFGRQELPILFLLSFLLLLFTGGGKYSVDHYLLLQKRNK